MGLIVDNLANIAVVLVVAGLVALALRKVIKDKKSHKCSCGGGCSGCPSAGKCHE